MRLVAERKKRGWSQCQLAMEARVHPSVISRLERGVWPPYTGWRLRIARALGWPPEQADELFEEVNEE